MGDFEVAIPPVIRVQLLDESYDPRFSFELPLNFKFEQHPKFVSVKGILGQYFGFAFKTEADTASFAAELKALYPRLA